MQEDDAGSSELVVIARAVRPRGLKGEIVAELLTDFPDRFEDLEEVVLVSPGGEQRIGKTRKLLVSKRSSDTEVGRLRRR